MNDEPSPSGSIRGLGVLLATLCAAFSGTAVTVGKVALEGMSALGFCYWLFLFSLPAGALLASVAGGRLSPRRIPRSGVLLLLAHAGLICVSLLMFWSGLRLLDPTVTVFLGRAEVLVAVGLGVVVFRERLGLVGVLGGLATVGGVIVMGLAGRESDVTGSGPTGSGFALVLGSAVLLGVAEVVAKAAVRYIAPAAMTLFRNVLLAAAFAVAAVATGQATLPSGRALAYTAAAAVLGPTLARFTFLLAIRRLEISWVTLLTQSTPLFTALTAAIVLGQTPGSGEWVGGAIVLAGCVLVVRRPPDVAVIP